MKSFFSDPARWQKIKLLGLDGLVVISVFLLSYTLRIVAYEQGPISQVPVRLTFLFPLAVLLHLVSFYIFGLYDDRIARNRKLLLINLILSVGAATFCIVLLSYIFPQAQMGRIILAMHVLLMVLAVFTWRFLVSRTNVRRSSVPVLIIGWGELSRKLAGFISQTTSGYRLGALLATNPGEGPQSVGNPAPVFHNFDEAMDCCNAQTIVVNSGFGERNDLKSRLVDIKFQGADIFNGPDFYKQMLGRVPANEISEEWLLYTNPTTSFRPNLYQHFKNVMDIAMAMTVLTMTSPFLLLVALLIKLDSKGPVFFSQERLGLNERPFTLYKFRTMVVDAEKHVGPCWAGENDPRFTRMGRFLRQTRLDEFPQFINVLKGEMSLVGPRPIRRYFADIFAEKFPFYRLRFKVKPGITGWAQVNMNYVNTEDDQYEKLEYELFYLYHQSLFLDAVIVLKTIQSMLRMKGG